MPSNPHQEHSHSPKKQFQDSHVAGQKQPDTRSQTSLRRDPQTCSQPHGLHDDTHMHVLKAQQSQLLQLTKTSLQASHELTNQCLAYRRGRHVSPRWQPYNLLHRIGVFFHASHRPANLTHPQCYSMPSTKVPIECHIVPFPPLRLMPHGPPIQSVAEFSTCPSPSLTRVCDPVRVSLESFTVRPLSYWISVGILFERMPGMPSRHKDIGGSCRGQTSIT